MSAVGLNGVSLELREFILDYFDSIEAIELLLLVRNDRERSWHADELNSILKSNPGSIASRLSEMSLKGILQEEIGDGAKAYRYGPSAETVDRLCTELAETYIVKRFTVINLLYSGEPGGVRKFADAFDLRRRQ